jgi:hypothetical protein
MDNAQNTPVQKKNILKTFGKKKFFSVTLLIFKKMEIRAFSSQTTFLCFAKRI